ncbi:MAG TPA: alkaline phosphatase family protein [Candidatus Dormibacteraeota bacterium]
MRLRSAARALVIAVILAPLAALAGPALPASAAGHGSRAQLLAKGAGQKIRHVFVIIQEGRSFDNYFGTYPGALGLSASTAVPANPGVSSSALVKPHHLTTLRTPPLDDSEGVAAAARNGGAMNGFVSAQANTVGDGKLALGYYDASEIPYYWQLARSYVLADHFFSSTLGGSTSNYEYAVAAQSWPTAAAGGPPRGQQTIFDRLDGAGVSWGYYIAHYNADRKAGRLASLHAQVPLLDLPAVTKSPQERDHLHDLTALTGELARGGVPAVSYVVQPGATEHAPGNVASGEIATVGLINAIMRSRYWKSSAIFLTWSDWGGWYDGVAPPRVGNSTYGFRVPALIVSPYARQGVVLHGVADLTSILKFIEGLYGLAPLTSRDANAGSLMGAFNLSQAPRPARPVTMGSLPPVVATQGSLPVIFVAYGVVGLMLAALLGYAASLWLGTGARWRRLWRRG